VINDKLQELDELMSRSAALVADAGLTASKDERDGSWYFSPSGDYYRHVFVRDGYFVIGQVNRARPEQDVFASPNARDMELFIAFWLCSNWRSQRRLPMLVTVPVPVTIDKVAPGFTIERDGSTWVLKESDAGAERRSYDDAALVKFSYYVNMSPEELHEACMAPEGKPPFFPLG
jgi:hypothetical protein